jgi:hypothetical protein
VGKDGAERRARGAPLALGGLIPALTRPAFRKRSPDAAQILADWPQVVGPEVARMAEPVRISAGTLTLACTGPAAMELAMGAPALIQRINAHLGRIAVRKLAFVQRAPRVEAARPKRPASGSPPAPLPPRVERSLDAVPGEELRLALERLAQGVFARKP